MLPTKNKLKTLPSRLVAGITETLLPAAAVERIRTARSWRQWVDRLDQESLADLSSANIQAKRDHFRRHVNLVEIETHAKCNRLCDFCPNVDGNRLKNEIVTDAAMLDHVFDELGSIDYERQIKIARYSEPLSNPGYLYERIASARRRVPRAQLAIVTNTDYLKPAVINRLKDAGLNVIYMSIYLLHKERWSLGLAHERSQRLAEKLGLHITQKRDTPTSVRYTFGYQGLDLHSSCINFSESGTDRGGLVGQYTQAIRKGPCWEPFETFVIDYTGSVMPCCNLLSDKPQHKDYVLGNLTKEPASIFDIYAGKLSAWRKSMVSFGKKESPCATCRHRDIPDDLVTPIALHLKKRLDVLGQSDLYQSPIGAKLS